MTSDDLLAAAADSDFPIQNLPYCSFSTDEDPSPRIGTRLGEAVIDLAVLDAENLLERRYGFFAEATLNRFMEAGRSEWRSVRRALIGLFGTQNSELAKASLRARAVHPVKAIHLHMPVAIGNYTDFYASREHATNVGTMFRGKENALLPNWLHLPVGYHGRASSIVISGTDVRRPRGQILPANQTAPQFAETRQLDFELEIGFFIGSGNALGEPIAIDDASDHIFGMVLLNDWSARDIQAWEYQPLGPFLAKNFATSISPWVVPMDALNPFRVPGPTQDPLPLPYLNSRSDYGFDIQLEVALQSEKMDSPQVISRTNMKYLYWNIVQQIAHHTIGGCNLQSGDLCGTGTISGPTADSLGSMLELAWRGERPITISSGESRSFLQDGDRVAMRGHCEAQGYRIGFGEVSGRIVPALRSPSPSSLHSDH